MKQLILISSLLAVITGFTQNNKPYFEWLQGIKELTFADSVYFNVPEEPTVADDATVIRNYFYPLSSPDHQQTEKPVTYTVMGKITSSPDYDIILLYKNNLYNDKVISRQLFMNTMSKSGKLLHFQLIAQHSVFNNDQIVSSCWFFKPGILKVTTSRTIMSNNLLHTMEFIINHHGTIVAQTRSIAGN